MGDWPNANLGDLASSEAGSIAIGPFGSRMKADVYVDAGVPVIRGTNISSDRSWKGEWVYITDDFADTMPNCNVVQDDLVFPHRGSIGEVAIVPGDAPRYMLSTSLMKFRANTQKLNPLFAFYFFRSGIGRSEILKFSSQVGTPGIGQPLTSLRQFKVPLPPLGVQTDIADFLAVLDDKIELNRRMNETLEAMARAIFKDWFMDFGPVRAKAEGRRPYLTPEIWSLFPDALDDDDKPVGWQVCRIEDYLELAYGKSLPANTRRPGLVTVYGSGGLSGFHDEALIDGPAVIVGRKGTVGSLYWEDRPVFPIDTVFYVVPKRGTLLFCYQLLLTQPLADMNTDAAVPGLNRGNAYRLEVPWPGPELTHAFEAMVAPLWKRRSANLRETETLVQTRDLLLPKLMSGEIRLRDAEKAVEAA